MAREKLPSRRRNITQKARIGGQKLHLTVGMYDDGRPGEVFIDLNKAGSALRAWADASAMLISVMLQYGVSIEEICGILHETDTELDYVGRWLKDNFRGGRTMLIQVTFEGSDTPYTYESDVELAIGDTVEVPANWICPYPHSAKVVALESTYEGSVKKVLRRLDEAAEGAV